MNAPKVPEVSDVRALVAVLSRAMLRPGIATERERASVAVCRDRLAFELASASAPLPPVIAGKPAMPGKPRGKRAK